MLRITPKETDDGLTLSLEGKLAGPWVAELAKAWSEWQGRVQPRDAVIDLRLVSFVDEAGRGLLVRLHGEGCALLGSGCYVGPLVDSILRGKETGAAVLVKGGHARGARCRDCLATPGGAVPVIVMPHLDVPTTPPAPAVPLPARKPGPYTGLVVDAHSHEELTAALARLLAMSSAERRSMGARGR